MARLNPIQYQFLSESELRSTAINTKEGTHIGLLAQELEQLFPEFVIDVAQSLENEEVEAVKIPKL